MTRRVNMGTMNQSARITAAAAVLKTAQIIESEHPGLWAEAYKRATAPPTTRAPMHEVPTPIDYLEQLHDLGGAATDTEWKRRCQTALGSGRYRFEKARAALLEQGFVEAQETAKGTAKSLRWTAVGGAQRTP